MRTKKIHTADRVAGSEAENLACESGAVAPAQGPGGTVGEVPAWARALVEASIQQAIAKLPQLQPEGFIELPQALNRTKLSERTFREALKRGILPAIRLKGGRRLLFHWPSLEASLLRFQKGGIL